MANNDIENPLGVTDKRVGRGVTGVNVLTQSDNMLSVGELRAALTTMNGTYYNTARLDALTKNDMIYALRLGTADSAGI